MWTKIKKIFKSLYDHFGDDLFMHSLFFILGKKGEKNGEEAGKVIGELIVRVFKGERTIEAWTVLINRLKPATWNRVVQYFKSHPSDVLESVVGNIWRACQNGVTYLKFNVDPEDILKGIDKLPEGERAVWAEYVRTTQVKDGLRLFLGTLEEIFKPSATDDDITAQLNLFHQAGPWQRFVTRAKSLVAHRPALARFLCTVTFVRRGDVVTHNPGGQQAFTLRPETDEEMTARALRRLAIGFGILMVLAIVTGIILLPILFYQLIIAPIAIGEASKMMSQVLWISLGIVVLAPLAWIAMRLAGFSPARRKFWAVLAFGITVGLAVRLLAFVLPLGNYPRLAVIITIAIAILAWSGIYTRLASDPRERREGATS